MSQKSLSHRRWEGEGRGKGEGGGREESEEEGGRGIVGGGKGR